MNEFKVDIFEKYYCIMWYLGIFYIIKEKKRCFYLLRMIKNIILVKKKFCLNDVWIEINFNKFVGFIKWIIFFRFLEDGFFL